MRLVIVGGTIVTASETFPADLLIEDGRIIALGEQLPRDGVQVLDAAGCLVIPGGVDVHTHCELAMDEFGNVSNSFGAIRVSDDMYYGTAAAAMGGTTCIVEHPGFGPTGCSLFHQLEVYARIASGRAVVDYAFHGVLQHVNQAILDEVPKMVATGYPTLKAYLTYGYALDDVALLAVLDVLTNAGGLLTVHAENHAIVTYLADRLQKTASADPLSLPKSRPPAAEAEAVQRVLALAGVVREGGVPVYLVHLSTAASLTAVRAARAAGQIVFAETCPQYLLLDQSQYAKTWAVEAVEGKDKDMRIPYELSRRFTGPVGLKYIMAPPLRPTTDVAALWQGLTDGSIDVVATDHCAFSLADKLDRYARAGSDIFASPGGIPGIETRLPLLFTYGVLADRISLPRLVALTATNPARIMGLAPAKGNLFPGADADIAILDPTAEHTISAITLRQAVDYTPFEGLPSRGWPRHVLLRGFFVVHNGCLVANPGVGRELRRQLS
ncbi:phenylhydantoinase [Desulfovibrionales bacterium]